MGKAFVFGDGISTDLLAPGNKLKCPPEELVRHCMTAMMPEFPDVAACGDIVFAGKNFGQGSSREQAVVSLQLLGIQAVLATSFARIFYRNALNLGLPIFEFAHTHEISAGDAVDLDLDSGTLTNRTTGKSYEITPLPPQLMKIVEAGGLIADLERRIGEGG